MHGISKIINTFETYHAPGRRRRARLEDTAAAASPASHRRPSEESPTQKAPPTCAPRRPTPRGKNRNPLLPLSRSSTMAPPQ